jgi:hypothetical protein
VIKGKENNNCPEDRLARLMENIECSKTYAKIDHQLQLPYLRNPEYIQLSLYVCRFVAANVFFFTSRSWIAMLMIG